MTYNPNQLIKTVLIFSVLLFPELVFSQSHIGRIFSIKTNQGIGYVDVGIKGKNIGTVSDDQGNFSINLDRVDENDSIRFSMIGFESRTFQVGKFRQDSSRFIYLNPKLYDLVEVKVIYHKPRIVLIGTEVNSGLSSGFGHNFLGSEFGIKVNVKRPVRLLDLNLNVASCTFDTVTYRLNIYQSTNNSGYKNILTKPIYIFFTKDKIKKPVTFDLSKYSIIVEGDVYIALELFRDFGEGKLFYFTDPLEGATYNRRTIEGSWAVSSGEIGMYLHGQLIQ
jgi:hypothetical protein